MTETIYPNIFVENEDVFKWTGKEYHKFSKWIDNTGYYQVVFRIDGKRKYVRVHRLIAETLLPNPDNLPQINHIDGNKLNNSLDNLEWVTNAKNTQHGYDNNLYRSRQRCHKVRTINKITNEILDFDSIRSCADNLGLNRKTITAILKGAKKTNNYNYNFEYLESVTTIPDECKGVESEISTDSKRTTTDKVEDIV